jgi:hypothetical protein
LSEPLGIAERHATTNVAAVQNKPQLLDLMRLFTWEWANAIAEFGFPEVMATAVARTLHKEPHYGRRNLEPECPVKPFDREGFEWRSQMDFVLNLSFEKSDVGHELLEISNP